MSKQTKAKKADTPRGQVTFINHTSTDLRGEEVGDTIVVTILDRQKHKTRAVANLLARLNLKARMTARLKRLITQTVADDFEIRGPIQRASRDSMRHPW